MSEINVVLKRSNRKTISIYVHNGEVEVRAPISCSIKKIDEFVNNKWDWIADKLSIQIALLESKAAYAKSLDYGSDIPVRGQMHKIVDMTEIVTDGKCIYIPPNLHQMHIKAACINTMRHIAKVYLNDRVTFFAEQMGVKPRSIGITSARTRWGSCSASQRLNFSWRIIMGSDYVSDYVVVHELAHIMQMNHSPAFWKIVQDVLPDYKQRQLKLRELQNQLSMQGWD